ncbi:Mphosph10 [Symbiodinium necroappetens]|uniref:Mphosph10 protein n=2 Tax=Symbiodinium TaxID=2949 RepID=A0A813BT94_9DINO|nr:U3 small nucleolar ribonucleoprotein MPP10 [Symbiodinium microadriaticum]CAE7922779.1 Mphosph10 [Symbiodinium necroappetens]
MALPQPLPELSPDFRHTWTLAHSECRYKLDMLSNAHFTPRPPLAGSSAEGLKVPSLKMEETIPLMVSDATLQAPEERRAPRRHVKDQAELTPDEKAAVRRTRKAARTKRLQDKVERGEMSLADRRARDAKLQEKNKAAKQEKGPLARPPRPTCCSNLRKLPLCR